MPTTANANGSACFIPIKQATHQLTGTW